MSVYFDKAGVVISRFDFMPNYIPSNVDSSEFKVFAVKNFQCVNISRDKLTCTFIWRPSRTSEICIAAVMYYLFDHKLTRCVVKTYDDELDSWSHRIFNSHNFFGEFLGSPLFQVGSLRSSLPAIR
jgi:hypothetical protein